jgi:hypothetical protein
LKSLKPILLALTVTAALAMALPASSFGANWIADPGFESATGGDSPAWSEADNLFVSPLCKPSECDGNSDARTGDAWAWFGGSKSAQNSWLFQEFSLPHLQSSRLSFYLSIPSVAPEGDANLKVELDDKEIMRFNKGNAADYSFGYKLVSLELPDGFSGDHTLYFEYNNSAATDKVNSFLVDDIALEDVQPPPLIREADTSEPGGYITPSITGNAPGDGTVQLFADANCAGPVVATGAAGVFGTVGLPLTVSPDTAVTVAAKQTGAGFHSTTSRCSEPFTFTTISPKPKTRVTKKPTKITRTNAAKIMFKSDMAGSTFKCKLDGGRTKSCTSPLKLKHLKLGKHTLRVTAFSIYGKHDASPAIVSWKIKKR